VKSEKAALAAAWDPSSVFHRCLAGVIGRIFATCETHDERLRLLRATLEVTEDDFRRKLL